MRLPWIFPFPIHAQDRIIPGQSHELFKSLILNELVNNRPNFCQYLRQ